MTNYPLKSLGIRLAFILFLFLALGVPFPTPARAAMGDMTGIARNGDTLIISVGPDRLIVQVCKPELLRVDFLPGGVSSPDTAIIGKPGCGPVGASIQTGSDPIVITTGKMVVRIGKTPVRLAVYDASGTTMLLKEQNDEGVHAGGLKLNYLAGSNFYGIGGYSATEDSSAKIQRTSGGTVLAGSQGDGGAPLVWSNKGYGILVDSDSGRFSMSAPDRLSFSGGSKKDLEYYVAVGSPTEILSAIADISGKPPMFPKWAMGFTNSEWGITQADLISYVDGYRSRQIPIDNYTLDFDWKAWGEDNYGEWRWNENSFPDGPSGLLKTIMTAKGIKLTGIMKPRIHTDTVQGQYATTNECWFPGRPRTRDYFSGKPVNELNFAIASCRTWYFEHFKDAFNLGIIGYWNDEADNVFSNWQFMNMQRALYEGQRSYTNQRVWSVNRNFYLGSQRYAYGTWSGDIPSGFPSMANQRERMLSLINIGQAKWGMDIGGFSSAPTPENYARWMEFGAFVPIYRVHGTEDQQRQPWLFGATAEAASKKVMQLRYRLIPYIYAYERQAYETGIGLVKPLVFDYPTDDKVANYIDAWMFGDYLLVAPVVDPGQTSKEIYLPAGTWIDYFKGTAYTGNQTINYAVDSLTWADVPLFVKKGAIIPSQEFMNYVGERPVTRIDLDVFPDTTQTGFTYYDDDGVTFNYEKGVYFKQILTTRESGPGEITFNIGTKQGSYTPALRYYLAKIHGVAGANLQVNGRPVTKYDTLAALESASGEGWATGSDIYGDVTYLKVAAGKVKNIWVGQ